jgi:hypothetical protein
VAVTFTIDTSEIDAAAAALLGLAEPRAIAPLVPTLDSIARDIARVMAVYPPERPGSSYVRTGDLGRGWRVEDGRYLEGGYVVTASNAVEYAPWVQGDDQAWMHVGRWDTIGDAEKELTDPAAEQIADAVHALYAQVGR